MLIARREASGTTLIAACLRLWMTFALFVALARFNYSRSDPKHSDWISETKISGPESQTSAFLSAILSCTGSLPSSARRAMQNH
ncbi:hypothetical protein B0H11DRAFT_1995090 [Mycena galericulata]|nr:hypothetical protein B0H11DRAFT_1995090 [Mycena galericulata]